MPDSEHHRVPLPHPTKQMSSDRPSEGELGRFDAAVVGDDEARPAAGEARRCSITLAQALKSVARLRSSLASSSWSDHSRE